MGTDTQFVHETISSLTAMNDPSRATLRTPEELASIVLKFASANGWLEKVRLRRDGRWYERLYHGPDYDIWVISWLPDQGTGFHDHGESAGAFVVATGVLQEERPGERPRVIQPGEPCVFGSNYTHDVRNESLAPAISIHAYSPPLTEMNGYELNGGQLVPRDDPSWKTDLDHNLEEKKQVTRRSGLTIEEVLSGARTRLRRLSPNEAYEAAVGTGAILVDIRPENQRASEGTVAGALVVERNVLEWRFDPASSARLPIANDHDLQVIVFCSEGYTSSLAAASLQDLGLWRATDMVGGFRAWRKAGLPVLPLGNASAG